MFGTPSIVITSTDARRFETRLLVKCHRRVIKSFRDDYSKITIEIKCSLT